MLQAPKDFGMNANKNSEYKCKNEVDKNGYRRRIWTSKTAKIYRFVRFVMYCITTCLLRYTNTFCSGNVGQRM